MVSAVPASSRGSVGAPTPHEAIVFVQGRAGGLAIVAASPGHATRRLTRGMSATPSPDGTWMLVARSGGWYVMRANGASQRRLPVPAGLWATWSPNGKRISLHDLNQGRLLVIGRDASKPVAVAGDVSAAAWSPDSRELLYAFDPQTAGVYTVRVAGDSPAATVRNEGEWASQPDWSPNGRRLAYVFGRPGAGDVYVANADGSARLRLTATEADESDPAWSPDGKRIAFASARDGNWEIYVMNADGSGQRRLTFHRKTDQEPAWSPDGSRLAFHSSRFGQEEILIVNRNGSRPIRVTRDSNVNRQPDWSPDGSALVYGGRGLSVIRSDGTGFVRLTTQELDASPRWSPDGARVVFERDGRILTVDRRGGKPEATYYSGRAPAADPTWSPDGRVSFWIAHESDLARFDVRRKATIRVTRTPEDETEPAWSPRGRSILYRGAGRLVVRNLRLGTETTVARGEVGAFDWSSSGRFIAYDRGDDLFRVRPNGSRRRRIVATGGDVLWAWAPRDDRLAYAVTEDAWGRALVVVEASGAKRSIKPADLDGLSPPFWSPSGRKLAYAGIRHLRRDVIDFYVHAVGARSATRVFRVRRSSGEQRVQGWVRVRL